jgi:hypothetical protein
MLALVDMDRERELHFERGIRIDADQGYCNGFKEGGLYRQ